MGASPNGLVMDPSEQQPLELVEIKCPAHVEKSSLFDLYAQRRNRNQHFASDTFVIHMS